MNPEPGTAQFRYKKIDAESRLAGNPHYLNSALRGGDTH